MQKGEKLRTWKVENYEFKTHLYRGNRIKQLRWFGQLKRTGMPRTRGGREA